MISFLSRVERRFVHANLKSIVFDGRVSVMTSFASVFSGRPKNPGWMIVFFFVVAAGICCMGREDAVAEENIKTPNVSGAFYDADPGRLKTTVNRLLDQAEGDAASGRVEVLVVPHAGYRFSGAVAAAGFKAVAQQDVRTIVLVGPSHYFAFDGVAVWPDGGFRTPLGVVKVDSEMASGLMNAAPYIYKKRDVYEKEHALEVELPFIQTVFPEARIVPMLVGRINRDIADDLGGIFRNVIGERQDVLVVVSADLSHFHEYEEAVAIDERSIAAMVELDIDRVWTENLNRSMEIDAFMAMMGALAYAKERGVTRGRLLKYENSGDVTGDHSRVVGYAALTFSAGEPDGGGGSRAEEARPEPLNREQKIELLELARETITSYLEDGEVRQVDLEDPRLREREGIFVTLHNPDGSLRGCIGHIIGTGPMCVLVRDMAIQSATNDPRFQPVTLEEFQNLDVEVSVLSRPRKISDPEKAIELGRHGVIVSKGPFHRGVFLPQVAVETGWDLDTFMGELCSQKARLPRDCWKDPQTTVEVFTADVFAEKDLLTDD